jgi:hypothetical protein
MERAVQETARLADGWMPLFFDPVRFHEVWGDDLKKGTAERDDSLGALDIVASGMLAIGEKYAHDGANTVLDLARPLVALYVGGMGAREKNFYKTICERYGYVQEAADIQDLYLDGRKDEAASRVPHDFLADTNLVGPDGYIKERIAAYREAGVTQLQVMPMTDDPVTAVARLRELID